MNKISSIISLLLIVASASCIEKVSYSDIVSSLMQVSKVEKGSEIVELIYSSFNESIKLSTAYDNTLTAQCNAITERADRRAEGFKNSLNGMNNSIKDLEDQSKNLAETINASVEAQEGNKKNSEKLREEILDGASNLQEKTMAIVSRQRVLQRLSNLVQDELVGKQRESTVGNYKVDNKASGYSFVEVHNQLREFNSKDAIVRSMISTLIMITQDQKNLFANHEAVGKIVSMIDQIIKKDAVNAQKLREEAETKAAALRKSISELSDTMMNLMNSIAENKAQIVADNNVMQFTKAEIRSMESRNQRANVRSASNFEMCNNLKKLTGFHNKVYVQGHQKFEELRKQLQ